MPEAKEWVAIALGVIKKEAGDSVYAQYESVFTEIATDQAELRSLLKIAQDAGDSVKEKEYREAYDATLLNIKNVMLEKRMDLQDSTLDKLTAVLRIVFRVMINVVAGA